jgi:hypothetical protein
MCEFFLKIYKEIKYLMIKVVSNGIKDEYKDIIQQVCIINKVSYEDFMEWFNNNKSIELEEELMFFFHKD